MIRRAGRMWKRKREKRRRKRRKRVEEGWVGRERRNRRGRKKVGRGGSRRDRKKRTMCLRGGDYFHQVSKVCPFCPSPFCS